MAFNPAPSSWLGAGYTYASNAITMTTAAGANAVLTELTAAEANATTGDVREVFFAMCEAFWQSWDAKVSADRPVRMSISKQSTIDSSGNLIHNYGFNFTNEVVSENLLPE